MVRSLVFLWTVLVLSTMATRGTFWGYLRPDQLLVLADNLAAFTGGRPLRSSGLSGKGSTTLKRFLSQFERVSKSKGWDDLITADMLMASLQDEAIVVLMRLPETPTYSQVVEALWKRFPGLTPKEQATAFSGAVRQLGEDIGSFANRLEDMYDQEYPGICRDIEGLQLLSKLWETLPSNLTDILLASKYFFIFLVKHCLKCNLMLVFTLNRCAVVQIVAFCPVFKLG